MNEVKRVVRNVFNRYGGAKLSWMYLDEKTGEFRRKPTKTKQADKDSCDINKILSRFEKTGQLPAMIAKEPRWGDFATVPDFMEAHELVQKAHEQFEALDSSVRKRFHHDPMEMLAFCQDPANADEMVRLGLAKKKDQVEESVKAAAAVPPAPST